MPVKTHPHPAATSDSSIVTKAVLRAADILDVKDKHLARIIGLSPATISRMRKGDYPLEPGQKPFELAVLFLRMYRALDTLVGGDEAVARHWLANHNTALNDVPITLIQTVAGLSDVIQYLDARRAIV